MKTFLNSFWNFVSSFISSNSPLPSLQWEFQKFPFPLVFLPPLILENFSSPWILLSSKIQSPPLHKEGVQSNPPGPSNESYTHTLMVFDNCLDLSEPLMLKYLLFWSLKIFLINKCCPILILMKNLTEV